MSWINWNKLEVDQHIIFNMTSYENIIKNSLCIRGISFYEMDIIPSKEELIYLSRQEDMVYLISRQIYCENKYFFHNCIYSLYSYSYLFSDADYSGKINCRFELKSHGIFGIDTILPIKRSQSGMCYL